MDALEKLMAAHPKLFRGEEPCVPSHLPDGWYALMDSLCADIEVALADDASGFTFIQIKEKFGSLRAYFDLNGSSDHFIDIHDEEGGLETVVNQSDGPGHMKLLRELVEAAREASARTCMVCGAPGNARVVGGWYSTLCDGDAAAEAKGPG